MASMRSSLPQDGMLKGTFFAWEAKYFGMTVSDVPPPRSSLVHNESPWV